VRPTPLNMILFALAYTLAVVGAIAIAYALLK
jgi:hypothetical protein